MHSNIRQSFVMSSAKRPKNGKKTALPIDHGAVAVEREKAEAPAQNIYWICRDRRKVKL